MKYHHTGIPTQTARPGEIYMEGAKLYITEPTAYAVEWLRFEAGSPMPQELQTMTHQAFEVEDIAQALAGKQVLIPPFEPMPGLRCAFIMDDGMPVEFMQHI